MILLEQLSDIPRAAFAELLRETWDQTWDDDLGQKIIQWRYYDRPGEAATWVVMKNDRCIGMLDSVLRPYILNGRRVVVRETADWYCTPAFRPFGVGLWLLRQVTKRPESVFVLGGSTLTADLLGKLGWLPLPSVSSYILPIKARNLVGNLIRHQWSRHESFARVIPQMLPARRPKTIAAPTGGRAEVLAAGDPVTIDAPSQTGLAGLLETPHWQWLARMPAEMARPVGLLFLIDDKPVGLSFSQIEPSASGFDAKIVHLQLVTPVVADWVVSATTQLLAEHGVGFIRCYVSTVDKITALENVGFIQSKVVPCFWLPRDAATPSTVDASYLRGDDAMPFQSLRGRIRV